MAYKRLFSTDMEEEAEGEQSSVHGRYLNDEANLQKIEDGGQILVFGGREDQVLDSVDSISRIQVAAFEHSYTLNRELGRDGLRTDAALLKRHFQMKKTKSADLVKQFDRMNREIASINETQRSQERRHDE